MTQPDPKPAKPKKPKKPRRWRRRAIIAVIVIVVLGLVFRGILGFILPSVINKVARGYGLQCTYDRLDLRIAGGNAALWNFRVLPVEGGDPILRADYLEGDISITGLLKGQLVVYRAAADGLDVNVQRNADGIIPILEHFAAQTPAPATTKPAANTPPSAPDLQPPLRLDALRIEHVRAHFRDLYVQPTVDTELDLDVRLTDLGNPGEPTRFELDFSSEPILDTLQIEGRSTGNSNNLSADLSVLMRGLHLKPLQGYLLALGLRPTADDISAAMTGMLTANVAPNPADGIQANLSLENAHIASDNSEAAAIDHLNLTVDSLAGGVAKFGKLTLSGVRCNAGRNPNGSVAVAGVELVPVPPQPPPAAVPASATSSAPFQWSLGQFLLTHLHVGFDDQAISPPVTLALNSPKIEVDHVSSNPTTSPSTFTIALNSPGLVQQIEIAGRAVPDSPNISFKLTAQATGINPIAAEPYLNAAGLTSEWKDGTFNLAADGSATFDAGGKVTASAHLADFRLADRRELLTLNDADIRNVILDAANRTLHADSIEVTGPGLNIHRDSGGSVHLLAFKTRPAATQPVVSASDPPAASTTSGLPPAFDHFEIDHFAWKGLKISLADDSISPPAKLAITDGGIDLDHFSIYLHPTAANPDHGTFKTWLTAPQIASRLGLDGDITSSPNQTNCQFQIAGEGIHADALEAYLKPLGIQPTLEDGSLHLHAIAQLDTSADEPKITFSCDNLKFNDGSEPLVSVGKISIVGISPTNNGVSFDSISVDSPHAEVFRDSDGVLEAGGLRFVAPPPPAPQADPAAISSPPLTTQAASDTAIHSLKISDVAVDWDDKLASVRTSLHLNADLSNFILGPDSKPAPFHVTAAIDGSLDKLSTDGSIAISPTNQSVRTTINVSGLRAGAAAAYLPPNVRVTLKNGQFHSSIAADIAKNPAGGQAIDLKVSNVDYRDAGSPDSLFQFDSLHLAVPRHDMSAQVANIDELTLDGLQTTIRKTPAGMQLLGLLLANSPQADPPADPPANPPADPPSTSPAADDTLRQIAAQRKKCPYLTLNNLNLFASKIYVIDETNPAAKPLIVSNLRIHNPAPITLLGKDPESNPPTQVDISGKLDPIAENFDCLIKATPFSRQKNLGLDLTVSDIHGDGLTAIAPGLASTIDGSNLEHGQLRATVSATLKLQTVLPTDFDLAHGGKLDLSVTNFAFRAEPNGPVLAGIGEIHSEAINLAPNLAGVEARELEIDNLTARAERKSDGIHVLGLIVKTLKASADSDTSPVILADAQSPNSDPPPAPVPHAPGPEYKIDRLLISGLDLRIEDQTTSPPTIIPLNGLDVEAQGLSNLDLSRDLPIRFNLLASADKVPLTDFDTGQTEHRELFSQVAGSGVVSLYPNLKGWTKLSLNGFELPAIRGLAAEKKVKLGAGTFDTNIDIRFPGDGSMDTSTKMVLTDLSLSEPPDGYIRRTLNLPAPLDLVILALQDQDGSITIPLNVPIKQGDVNTPAIVASGAGALAEIIATAVASSPLKLTNLLGLNSKPAPYPPLHLVFPPGYSALNPDQLAMLQRLADQLRKDKTLQVTLRCDPGRSDIALARQRVNPGRDNAVTIASALARRRAMLLAARLDAASQVRALLASTDLADAAASIERLRTIDRQLYDTENAMDYAYDLLRPGADRQAARRTRAAALAIDQGRLQSVRDYLTEPNKKPISADRIHLTNPQYTETPPNDAGSLTITIIKTK